MSPFFEWLLIGWSLLAAGWWGIATWLVTRGRGRALVRRGNAPAGSERKLPTLSIFKPIASLQSDVPSPQLIGALESFVSQMDGSVEMLLGIEDGDAEKWQPVIEQWRRGFPQAELKPVVVPRPTRFLSPKVSWFYVLAAHAGGELWMWSRLGHRGADGIARHDATGVGRWTGGHGDVSVRGAAH